jgi:hypothetical protein
MHIMNKVIGHIIRISAVSPLLVAVILMTFGSIDKTYAFHSGGVAECMGCHNIHDGQSVSSLLIAVDITSTCANAECHGNPSAGDYHILTPTSTDGVPPAQMTPGGDFGWLLKTYTWSPQSGTSSTEDGFEHGHNVVAGDIPGFIADPVNTTAPGGDMPAGDLSCNSCHDNHGKMRRLSNGTFTTTGAPIVGSGSYTDSADPLAGQAVGAYRLLRGPGSGAGSGGKTFNTVFNAVVASTYNRSEATGPTAMAYGMGISDWCATCHPDMHSGTSSKLTHPVNQGFSSTVADNYNAYLGSGLTGNSGFDTIVPFQDNNVTSYVTLRSNANIADYTTRDAATSSRVMCLSCHRAHASGFAHMTRWQNEGDVIAADGVWPGTDSTSTIATSAKYAMGRTTAETAAAYNYTPETKYASYQRSLCNKCHAKD